MPDYIAILTLYRMHATAALSGALASERDQVASGALNRVAESFLSTAERTAWDGQSPAAQAALLRLGRQRLHRWELANPDISSLLRRKAGIAAIG